jgi:hypothetical protein
MFIVASRSGINVGRGKRNAASLDEISYLGGVVPRRNLPISRISQINPSRHALASPINKVLCHMRFLPKTFSHQKLTIM